MPKVPGEVVPFKPGGAPAPQLDPTAVWMAAAMMRGEGKFAQADSENPDFAKAVRENGETRVNPSQPAFKEFEKKLPDDIEVIDKGSDVGRGPGESIRLRLKGKALTS